MESLDLLNLRAGECSFLEIALADVRRYITTFVSENNKKVVLVFPPFSARNRFLIHTLVQHFFNELSTISIGNSYGRRTVVYHSSLTPMLRETELEESNMVHNGNDTCMHRAYRTPSERKAQEKLFQSLMPKKKVDKSARSTQRRESKRPDIPIYVPKARRGLVNNTVPSISSTTNSSIVTPPQKLDIIPKIEDNSSFTMDSKELNDSSSPFNINSQQKNNVFTSLESFQNVDKILVDEIDTVHQTSFDDISSQISEPLSSSFISGLKNIKELNVNSSISDEVVETKSPILKCNESESNVERINSNNCDNNLINSKLSDSFSDSTNNIPVDDLSDFQISDIKNEIIDDDILLSQNICNTNNVKSVDDVEIINNENVTDILSSKQEYEICLGDEVVDSSMFETQLKTEYDNNCPNYCLDDSFSSGLLTDKEENISNCIDEELTIQQNSESVNKSLDTVKTNEKKKKKKKKVLDVDECSWEDLYDKEDDYIHPLLMKELISSMGKVQVKCAKEDYRSHQTIEERSGDGECVIEVYGFSSDLKTIDLMNQFAAFRKQKFEIVWVDDTHALAVFESPQLADRALNTPFALVKTRSLKNAIRESKLKAETIAPLPATRPKTCTAMARRLVSNALGLKVNVSAARLNAERTLLANAKEKKIRDSQQKHDIWNES